MRLITEKIVRAFYNGVPLKVNNSRTDGHRIWLFGNLIVERRGDGIYITNAGWQSRTTMERLNGLLGVHVTQRKGEWFLNGLPWDGEWIRVAIPSGEPIEVELQELQIEVEFDTTLAWNKNHEKPIYAVFHSHEERDLQDVEQILQNADIPTRRMYTDTSGVYLPNHFVVVPIADFERAKQLLQ